MSFSRNEPGRWTGQTIFTQDLIETGFRATADLLHRCAQKMGNPGLRTALQNGAG